MASRLYSRIVPAHFFAGPGSELGTVSLSISSIPWKFLVGADGSGVPGVGISPAGGPDGEGLLEGCTPEGDAGGSPGVEGTDGGVAGAGTLPAVGAGVAPSGEVADMLR